MHGKKPKKKSINDGFRFTHTYMHKNPSFLFFSPSDCRKKNRNKKKIRGEQVDSEGEYHMKKISKTEGRLSGPAKAVVWTKSIFKQKLVKGANKKCSTNQDAEWTNVPIRSQTLRKANRRKRNFHGWIRNHFVYAWLVPLLGCRDQGEGPRLG